MILDQVARVRQAKQCVRTLAIVYTLFCLSPFFLCSFLLTHYVSTYISNTQVEIFVSTLLKSSSNYFYKYKKYIRLCIHRHVVFNAFMIWHLLHHYYPLKYYFLAYRYSFQCLIHKACITFAMLPIDNPKQ